MIPGFAKMKTAILSFAAVPLAIGLMASMNLWPACVGTGHDHLAGRSLRMYRAHVKVCWKHRALYRRVYGLRGIVKIFLLLSSLYLVGDLYLTSKSNEVRMKTRCVDRGMRIARRFLKVWYQ